jgi:hypothetical protein
MSKPNNLHELCSNPDCPLVEEGVSHRHQPIEVWHLCAHCGVLGLNDLIVKDHSEDCPFGEMEELRN